MISYSSYSVSQSLSYSVNQSVSQSPLCQSLSQSLSHSVSQSAISQPVNQSIIQSLSTAAHIDCLARTIASHCPYLTAFSSSIQFVDFLHHGDTPLHDTQAPVTRQPSPFTRSILTNSNYWHKPYTPLHCSLTTANPKMRLVWSNELMSFVGTSWLILVEVIRSTILASPQGHCNVVQVYTLTWIKSIYTIYLHQQEFSLRGSVVTWWWLVSDYWRD